MFARKPMLPILTCFLGLFGLISITLPSANANAKAEANVQNAKPSLLLAHYMPWYMAKPYSQVWGWHWTMGHYLPDAETTGRKPAASHYYPLVGLYDSADPQLLDCQCLLMKLAGIDGVIIDWYGTDDRFDYSIIHQNTLKMIAATKRCGLKYAICYEDSTVPGLISAGKFKAEEAVAHTASMMKWIAWNWFADDAYVKLDGKPLFLVFGNGYFQGDQWSKIFYDLPVKPALFTEAALRTGATGVYDWVEPNLGSVGIKKSGLSRTDRHLTSPFMPAAFPRFHDIYAEAGVQKSYGSIPDDGGKTFETTLRNAINLRETFVQLATWNDWGEGTQIEPSVEFGYRDLETIQRLRKSLIDPKFPFQATDLRLPIRLIKLQQTNKPVNIESLKSVQKLLMAGKTEAARAILAKIVDKLQP